MSTMYRVKIPGVAADIRWAGGWATRKPDRGLTVSHPTSRLTRQDLHAKQAVPRMDTMSSTKGHSISSHVQGLPHVTCSPVKSKMSLMTSIVPSPTKWDD
jgi:hypothetical protein